MTEQTYPRVTMQDIEDNIASEHYFTAADQLKAQPALICTAAALQRLSMLSFCVLILKNGFIVTGESACVSPENFDAAIGWKIARENAIAKIWPLMGYALKSKLAEQ